MTLRLPILVYDEITFHSYAEKIVKLGFRYKFFYYDDSTESTIILTNAMNQFQKCLTLE